MMAMIRDGDVEKGTVGMILLMVVCGFGVETQNFPALQKNASPPFLRSQGGRRYPWRWVRIPFLYCIGRDARRCKKP
jgi:hypothetical protein